jgi:hypothetical protein
MACNRCDGECRYPDQHDKSNPHRMCDRDIVRLGTENDLLREQVAVLKRTVEAREMSLDMAKSAVRMAADLVDLSIGEIKRDEINDRTVERLRRVVEGLRM